ncbi:alpha/beta hydrolase [Gordonia rhizosphera NBRC 16068]|uniref:alpha/beta hydrolase n=1 Tax=Gordonia rhizosphera TaxID=83341 RepID=UPI003EE0E77A
MRPPPLRRARLGATLCAIVAVVVSGCAIGPDTGPDVVTGGGGGGAAPSSSSATPEPPMIEAPKTDLTWTECARATATRYGVTAPAGVTVECAELDTPIDPDRPTATTLTVALTRARVTDTPPDAAPVVLTAGTDVPSSRALLLLARGPGRSLLTQHPVVAVDRRGTPTSSPLDCMTRFERSAMATNGLAGNASMPQSERIDRLARAAASASDGCNETLSPNQLDFGVAFAAADLEALRIRWGVAHLALLGLGEGSDVVLAYAADYAGRAGRIILDTPTPFDANARDRAAVRATGVQAALRTFAQQCAAAAGCSLGDDGMATIGDVLAMGRTGRLGGLSDTEALNAITSSLAVSPNDPRDLATLARSIVAAQRGDVGALTAAAGVADELRTTDGQLVSRCNDVTGPVGQNEIPGLVDAWTKQNPLTGADSALSLLRCNAWATASATNPPSALPVDPLILAGANDPINGGGGADTLNALFIKAGVSPTTVTWEGLGYSVLARSSCAADVVTTYLGDQPLGEPGQRGCPV